MKIGCKLSPMILNVKIQIEFFFDQMELDFRF